MFDFAWSEIAVIGIVALVAIGPKDMPAAMKAIARMVRKARSMAHKVAGWFPDDPVDMFRAQVWINPFWEDDVVSVVEQMGADRVVFGSDWPHIEGMPRPLDYLPEVKELSAADQRLVLHDNAAELLAPATQ